MQRAFCGWRTHLQEKAYYNEFLFQILFFKLTGLSC
uniref:Uncharacterized protein n=1 Tax=Arundo donax TaxID=35708 RepID=A0A0A9GW65_ARUDO